MKFYTTQQLNLLREIVFFQFKIKDQSTFLGYLWSFLNPMLMLLILFFVFNSRIGQGIEHYGSYLLIGIVQYTHFSNATIGSMQVLYNMRQLTKETVFPKELLVIGSVLSKSVEFIITYLITIAIAVISGVYFSLTIFLSPLVILLQILFVFWISLLLSCFYIYFRDFEHIFQVFLRALFFLTPIFYEFSYLENGVAKSIILLNPLTHLIRFSRELIIEGELFSLELFLIFFIINMFLTLIAFKTFRKFEPTFAEYV